MSVFEINCPTRVIIGSNIINRLPEIIRDFGERILIVTSPQIEETSILKKVQNLAEAKSYGVIIFNNVDSQTGINSVDEGVLLARESKTDLVIGLGGSNTLNTAKAIAYIAGSEGYTRDYLDGKMGQGKKLGYIEIPTTHGISYGLLDSFYIKDENENIRREYRSRFNYADVVLSDPRLTFTLQNKYIVALGIEVLAYAIEAFISKAANPLTVSYAEHTMRLVSKNLKKAITDIDNVAVRHALSSAGIFASMALNSSRPGTAFALALPLATRMGLYHGLAVSILLPHVMEFNLTASPNKYVKIAKALGEDVNDITVVEAAIKAVEAIRKILFDLNVPQRLKNFEIDQGKLDMVVRDARSYDFLNVLPRPATYDDLLNILMSSY